MEMNCKGLVSPQPILFVREVLKNLDPEDTVTVIIDQDKAAQDLMEYARSMGDEAVLTTYKGEQAVEITRKANGEKFVRASESGPKYGSIVSVNSSRFGQGNPRLGESLMQSFFYTLSVSDPLPEAVIFMNSAVNLVCTDSPVLQDLRKLQEEGVALIVDEASLNFYGFRDRLEMGERADMMEITSILMQAQKTLNL